MTYKRVSKQKRKENKTKITIVIRAVESESGSRPYFEESGVGVGIKKLRSREMELESGEK